MLLIKTYIAIAKNYGLDIDKLDINIFPSVNDETVIILSDGSGSNIQIYSKYNGERQADVYDIVDNDEGSRKDLLQYLIDERLL